MSAAGETTHEFKDGCATELECVHIPVRAAVCACENTGEHICKHSYAVSMNCVCVPLCVVFCTQVQACVYIKSAHIRFSPFFAAFAASTALSRASSYTHTHTSQQRQCTVCLYMKRYSSVCYKAELMLWHTSFARAAALTSSYLDTRAGFSVPHTCHPAGTREGGRE